MQQRAVQQLNTEFYYRRIDVRDTELLNNAIESIANAEGRLDGLVAAAGIQQETPALEYTAKDANTMFEVNVTGVFMTAQAVAKQMIRFGNGGSIALIASMSGTVANRVSSQFHFCHIMSCIHHPCLPRFSTPGFLLLISRALPYGTSTNNNRTSSVPPTTQAKLP